MLVVHVHVQVRPDSIEAFKQATVVNSRASLKEPGIARFDVIQHQEEPERFVLVEVYRGAEDPARHKETEHYKVWRNTVEPMMAAPRRSEKYWSIAPADAGWETQGG